MKLQPAVLQAIEDLAKQSISLHEAAQRVGDFRSQIESLAFSPWPPESLVGRQCNLPAAQWHLAQFLNAMTTDAVRSEYHARWLAYLLEPENPARYPLTSIIIPVYNRREIVAEAIQSCFEQNCNIEVIVVDDGSTDDLETALWPIRERVIFHRQDNRGASAARNAGLRLAKGMYVRFLDSDDLLDPACTKLFIAAFAAIPDADVCISPSLEYDPRGWGLVSRLWEPDGRPTCPTTDLMRVEFPALLSATTLSRWFALSLPPFDEMLLKTHDVRYWFQIALRGAKAIALTEPLVERRRTTDSLTLDHREETFNDEIVLVANIIDALSSVDKWPYLLELMTRFEQRNRWMRIDSGTRSLIPQLRADFLQAIRSLRPLAMSASVSELPALMSLLAGMSHIDARGHISDEGKKGFCSDVRQAIRAGLIDAPPISASDAVLWMGGPLRPQFSAAISLCAAAPEISGSYSKCINCIGFLRHWATGDPEQATRVAELGSGRQIWSHPSQMISRLLGKKDHTAPDQFLEKIVGVVGYADAQALLKDPAMTEMLEPLAGSHPSAQHHFARLKRLSNEPPGFSMFIARYLDTIRFHARWLAYFITPQRLPSLPNVLVIFQLPNTPGELHRLAIESILAQTYPAVDAVIVADLRNSEVQSFLAGFEGQVSGLHQNRPNQAVAFNLGVTKYYPAEFSIFLENIASLEPEFVKGQMKVFADNPLSDVLVTPNTVTISRTAIHRVGMMDEWLSVHALTRYLFRLGLAGAREAVEACFQRLNRLSLSAERKAYHTEIATVVQLNLADAIEDKGLWEWIPDNWDVLSTPEIFAAVAARDNKYLLRAYTDFLQSIAHRGAPSPLVPVILNLLGVALARKKLTAGRDSTSVLLEIESRLLQAAERRGELDAEDRSWILNRHFRSASAIARALSCAFDHISRGEMDAAMRQGLELIRDQIAPS